MAKYLDKEGVETLWCKIKAKDEVVLSSAKTYTNTQIQDLETRIVNSDVVGEGIQIPYAEKASCDYEGNTIHETYIKLNEKAVVNGVATLDANGKVPSSQLPSYVDDVLEYANLESFPIEGEVGKIYVALDTNKIYRYSGTQYTVISETLSLGETASTAYSGASGKANATAIAALQEELTGKQDKLIAGDNITINGNVISATGGSSSELSVGDPITINEIEYNLRIADGVISIVKLGKYYTVTVESYVTSYGLAAFDLTDLNSDNFKILSYTGSKSNATAFAAKMLVGTIQAIPYVGAFGVILSQTPSGACSIGFGSGVNSIIISNITSNVTIKAEASCLTGDTLITLSDGSHKRIDSITLGDKVLSIDPETLELVEDEITYCDSDCNKTHNEYDIWTFENNYVVKTVHRHRLYNCESEAFVNMDEWSIGDHTRTMDGKEIALIEHQHIKELVNHYTLFTKKYNNYFANSILTGNKYSKELTFED